MPKQYQNHESEEMNYLGGGPMVRAWDQEVCSLVVSGSSPVVAHMMATGGLYGH
jgi:hypothetical protein